MHDINVSWNRINQWSCQSVRLFVKWRRWIGWARYITSIWFRLGHAVLKFKIFLMYLDYLSVSANIEPQICYVASLYKTCNTGVYGNVLQYGVWKADSVMDVCSCGIYLFPNMDSTSKFIRRTFIKSSGRRFLSCLMVTNIILLTWFIAYRLSIKQPDNTQLHLSVEIKITLYVQQVKLYYRGS